MWVNGYTKKQKIFYTMQIVLFDNKHRKQLYPFTETRSVADIRMGILTNKDRWEYISGTEVYILTEDYLQPLYNEYASGDILLIDASVIFSEEQAKKILQIPKGYYVSYSKGFIAGRFETKEQFDFSALSNLSFDKMITWKEEVLRLDYGWQIFQHNESVLQQDFAMITEGRKSAAIDDSNTCINPQNIFIEEGASISCSILNASTGVIYIGKNATIQEGCLIRGSFAMGENSLLKMGTKIYGATTLGNNCVGGGEIKNVVMFGNSNKAHEGYLGDSVIGEWCNLGAATSNSNVKNTAGIVNMYNAIHNNYVAVAQKCGVLMGDYTRTAINTSINTGSVYGVCCNIFGSGLMPKCLSNFSWGEKDKYKIDKAITDINNWQQMKNKSMSSKEVAMLNHLAQLAS
jgi:UDP-N-acetylglucosamine diphosphorylase / glucose-1-phosphate thymidylyltransferase / UDP-N-acetylgalactosamine diphosphorylase / glucosamine-1-phosphate N-acetyltransferase / galactosamine-1-phosphate N-acetyltransferase